MLGDWLEADMLEDGGRMGSRVEQPLVITQKGMPLLPRSIIIIIKRRSGINPIPPTVKDQDYKKKQKQRKKFNY